MAIKKKKAGAVKYAKKKRIKAKPKKIRTIKSKKAVKKKIVKAKKGAKKLPAAIEGVLIGKVSHYFPRVKAGAIIIKNGQLSLGDAIRIKGHTTDFKQMIASMQIDRKSIEKAGKGDEIGILVKSRVRIHDKVYRI